MEISIDFSQLLYTFYLFVWIILFISQAKIYTPMNCSLNLVGIKSDYRSILSFFLTIQINNYVRFSKKDKFPWLISIK